MMFWNEPISSRVKACIVAVGAVVVLFFAAYLWINIIVLSPLCSDSKTARTLSGAMKETIEARSYAVPASGTNLRVYEWTSKSGMQCVGVYANESNAWGDCEFLPK